MRDWSGKDIERGQNKENVAPIQGDKDNVNRPIPEEYELPPRQLINPEDLPGAKNAGDQYPVCPDCGRRHPQAGGPEDMGRYLSAQVLKMSAIRASKAAVAAERDFGGPTVVVHVLDKYIDLFTEPGEHREGFIEGLALGIGSSQQKVEQLEGRLEKLVGLMTIAGLLNIPRERQPREGE